MSKVKKEKQLKIFVISHGNGDKDWISAYTNIHALSVYVNFTDTYLIHFGQDDYIEEVHPKYWKEHFITDENGKNIETFSQFMSREKKPTFIASTNF